MGIQNYVAAAQANNNFARTLQAVQAGSPNYSDITRAGAMANLENELLARQLEGDMVVNATNAHGAVSVGKARAAIEEGKVLREQQRQKMAGRIAAQARRDRLMARKPKRPEPYIPQPVVMPVDTSAALAAQDKITSEGLDLILKSLGSDTTTNQAPSDAMRSLYDGLNPKYQDLIRKAYPEFAPKPTEQVPQTETQQSQAISPKQVIPLPKGISLQSINLMPTRPDGFEVIQYVSGAPILKDRESPNGLLVYDPVGHGGQNYHDHIQFKSQQRTQDAINLLRNTIDPFSNQPYRVTSTFRQGDPGAHGAGLALDVAPPLTLPVEDEDAWSRKVRETLGFGGYGI